MKLRKYSQAELLYTQRGRVDRPMLLMALISIGTFYLSQSGVGLLQFITISALILCQYIFARKNMELIIGKIYLYSALAIGIIFIMQNQNPAENDYLYRVGKFIIALLLCKIFDKKKNRDYLQIILLSVLLMLINSLSNWAIWFAVVLIIFACQLVYIMMLFTLKRGLDDADVFVDEPYKTGADVHQKNVARLSKYPTSTLRKFVSCILLFSVACGVLAFLFVPRIKSSSAGALVSGPNSRVGFSDQVKLGQAHQVTNSDKVIMMVKIFHNSSNSPVRIASGNEKYLRANILTAYSNSTWYLPARQLFYVRNSYRQSSIEKVFGQKLFRYEIDCVVDTKGLLSVPNTTFSVFAKGSTILQSPWNSFKLHNSQSYFDLSMNTRLSYRAYAVVPPYSANELKIIKRERAKYKSLQYRSNVYLEQADRKRIAELATRWCQDLLARRNQINKNSVLSEDNKSRELDKINLLIARRIRMNLQQRYSYTLDLREADSGRDGVIDFLFYMKKGHCQYFASSMAIMCTLLDIPARVAVGFVAEEYNSDLKSYLVREHDAHAWCEVYTESTDWKIFDPTPASAREEAVAGSGFGAWFSSNWERLNFQWMQDVVAYDNPALTRRFKKFTGKMSMSAYMMYCDLRDELKKDSRQNGGSWFSPLRIKLIVIGVSCVVVLIVLRKWGGKFFHLKLPTVKRKPKTAYQVLWVEKLIKLFRKNGYKPGKGKTLAEILKTASRKYKLSSVAVEFFVDLEYSWRWGKISPDEKDFISARKNYDIIRSEIARASKENKSARKIDSQTKTENPQPGCDN